MNETDWLAVGEGLIGFVLGILIGAVWALVRMCTGCSHHFRRHRAGDPVEPVDAAASAPPRVGRPPG